MRVLASWEYHDGGDLLPQPGSWGVLWKGIEEAFRPCPLRLRLSRVWIHPLDLLFPSSVRSKRWSSLIFPKNRQGMPPAHATALWGHRCLGIRPHALPGAPGPEVSQDTRGRLVWQQGLKVRGGPRGPRDKEGCRFLPTQWPPLVFGGLLCCGLGGSREQETSGTQGQTQVRVCRVVLGRVGIHRTLRRVCCHLPIACPSSSPSPPFSSLFSSNLLTSSSFFPPHPAALASPLPHFPRPV